jgi:hypothetical protein
MARFSVPGIFRTWLRVLRLSTYLACVFALLSLLALRSLRADMREAAHALGRQLADLPELTRGADVVLLNGARLHHSRTTTSDPVPVVLDRIEAHCNRSRGPLARALDEAAEQHPREFEEEVPRAFRNAVLREDSDDDGVVICFTDNRQSPIDGLKSAFERFTKTSDLSAFGNVRYAYAERQSDASTLVVLLWTNGSLNLSTMFPETGDAAGEDSRVLPRPPASRRTLAAAAEGQPYGLRSYESSKSAADTQQFYDAWMKREGWGRVAHAEREGATAYLRQDGYQAFVSLFEDAGHTYVTLIEAGHAAGDSIGSIELGESP